MFAVYWKVNIMKFANPNMAFSNPEYWWKDALYLIILNFPWYFCTWKRWLLVQCLVVTTNWKVCHLSFWSGFSYPWIKINFLIDHINSSFLLGSDKDLFHITLKHSQILSLSNVYWVHLFSLACRCIFSFIGSK